MSMPTVKDKLVALGVPTAVAVFAAPFITASGKTAADVPALKSATPIKDTLALITSASDKSTVKGLAWKTVGKKARTNAGAYDIEITDLKDITGGVEVYARAWDAKTGKQFGFGPDGTVDIERFVFINPPIMVPDGTTKTVFDDEGIAQTVVNLKEDAETALFSALNHTISVKKQKGNPSKIISGKIGRTTLVAYPQEGTGGSNTTFDAYFEYSYDGKTWAQMHDAASTTARDTGNEWRAVGFSLGTSDKWYRLERSEFTFDTTAVVYPSSAIFSFRGSSKSDGGSWLPTINVVASNPAVNNAGTATDFATFGTTPFSTKKTYANYSTSGYNDFTLNAAGLAAIVAGGITKLGIREADYDIPNIEPAKGKGDYVGCYFRGYFADQTGTTYDPKLVVEYTATAPENKEVALTI